MITKSTEDGGESSLKGYKMDGMATCKRADLLPGTSEKSHLVQGRPLRSAEGLSGGSSPCTRTGRFSSTDLYSVISWNSSTSDFPIGPKKRLGLRPVQHTTRAPSCLLAEQAPCSAVKGGPCFHGIRLPSEQQCT